MQLTDFLPEVYLEAPQCPEALALAKLLHTVREFCDRSHVWRADAEQIVLMAGFSEYDIDLSDGAELAKNGILRATQGGEPVTVGVREELPDDWREASAGDGIELVVPSRSSVRVYPTPATSDASPLILDVAMRPTLTSTICDASLGDWSEGIIAGTLARLKVMRDRPWSDREAVGDYRSRFDDACASAHAEVAKGHSRVKIMRTLQWGKA